MSSGSINVIKHILSGSSRPIDDISFSPDGDAFAVSAHDIGIRVYHSQTLELLRVFPSAIAVLRLAWSGDGRHLIYSTHTEGMGVVSVWEDITTPVAKIEGMKRIDEFAYNAVLGRIAIISADSPSAPSKLYSAKFDVETAQFEDINVITLEEHAESVTIGHDGRIFVGTTRGNVFSYDQELTSMDTLVRPLSTVGDKGREVGRLSVTSNGAELLVPSRNMEVTIYNALTGVGLRSIPTKTAPTIAIAHPFVPLVLSAGGQKADAVTTTGASFDQFAVHFYDRIFTTRLGELGGPIGTITCGSFDPSGSVLVIGSHGGDILVWKFPRELYNYRPQADVQA